MPVRTNTLPDPRHMRRWFRDQSLFIHTWLRSPRKTGAVVPSSRVLARVIASQIDPHAKGWVVELGAGTGAMTEMLLHFGIDPKRLLIIERNSRLCDVLRARFPELKILHADAQRLNEILAEQKIEQVNAIVSSLPLLSLPDEVCHKIIAEIGVVLKSGAFMMQFTYRRGSPIPKEELRANGLNETRIDTVWRNLPPASVWKFSAKHPL
ncbi:MAG: methyltransferase domain-containing protein [Rickettsiales bacterium]